VSGQLHTPAALSSGKENLETHWIGVSLVQYLKTKWLVQIAMGMRFEMKKEKI
jgi:hypothetical protein